MLDLMMVELWPKCVHGDLCVLDPRPGHDRLIEEALMFEHQ